MARKNTYQLAIDLEPIYAEQGLNLSYEKILVLQRLALKCQMCLMKYYRLGPNYVAIKFPSEKHSLVWDAHELVKNAGGEAFFVTQPLPGGAMPYVLQILTKKGIIMPQMHNRNVRWRHKDEA